MIRLLTAQEVAAALGRSAKWVLRNKDKIGWHEVGDRGVRFTEDDLVAYCERVRVSPAR